MRSKNNRLGGAVTPRGNSATRSVDSYRTGSAVYDFRRTWRMRSMRPTVAMRWPRTDDTASTWRYCGYIVAPPSDVPWSAVTWRHYCCSSSCCCCCWHSISSRFYFRQIVLRRAGVVSKQFHPNKLKHKNHSVV